jgi:hypothetical protein
MVLQTFGLDGCCSECGVLAVTILVLRAAKVERFCSGGLQTAICRAARIDGGLKTAATKGTPG